MISDHTLEAAILARKPDSAKTIRISFEACKVIGNRWTVTLIGDSFGEAIVVLESGHNLAVAIAKADVSLKRALFDATQQRDMAERYARDMGLVA
jgi:hypothetical protein